MENHKRSSGSSSGSRQQASKRKENVNKKQATPSQLRANHEKQQQQQKEVSKAAAALSNKNHDKQLDAKVKSLHEQSDKSLEAYSRKAKQMKDQISAALERQSDFHHAEPLKNVANLRDTILELSGACSETAPSKTDSPDQQQVDKVGAESQRDNAKEEFKEKTKEVKTSDDADALKVAEIIGSTSREANSDDSNISKASGEPAVDQVSAAAAAAAAAATATTTGESQAECEPAHSVDISTNAQETSLSSNCFEPLMARLDPKTKYVALKSSLERHFADAPQLLEPICTKFIYLTGQIDALLSCKEQQHGEIQRLTSIKEKLSDLCRELQKSNNQIRIESLQMIKEEQNKAKSQASKIQSTLAEVMKLFDESQQRTLSFKQENIELRGELKNLLAHCDNWEKCVETTLKQREIENRLAKAELARMSLIRNEEKEKFFREKSELLKALTMMKEQQSKIEDKEAKLRSDLTNYASKYDECQEIIHAGLSKFQVESKRMLKQIEQGRRDNIQLLNKYEASNKKIKQLLEEKQSWAQSMKAANNKLEALERLCRALKGENDKLAARQNGSSDSIQPASETGTKADSANGIIEAGSKEE